jgi:hypothetical protein
MKDSQDEATSPSQSQHRSIQGSQSKSSFNEAEYQLWSEKLRKQYGCTNGENQTPRVDARTWLADYESQGKGLTSPILKTIASGTDEQVP